MVQGDDDMNKKKYIMMIGVLVAAVLVTSIYVMTKQNKPKVIEPAIVLHKQDEGKKVGYSKENYDISMIPVMVPFFEEGTQMELVAYDNDLLLDTAIKNKEVGQYLIRQDTWTADQKVFKAQEIERVDLQTPMLNSAPRSFNLYLAGIDTRDGDSFSSSLTDANQVVTINLDTREILITSIPRDFYVITPCSDGQYDKLTHAGIGGIDCSKGAVEMLLNIKIDYYLRSNFTSFIKIIDLIGGIKGYSEVAFEAGDQKFNAGTNDLDGTKALAFVRARKGLPGGDRYRVGSQSNVIKSFIETLSNPDTVTTYMKMLPSMMPLVQTNLTNEQLLSWGVEQLLLNQPFIVTQFKLDGGDGQGTTYSFPTSSDYYMIPNTDLVNQATEQINALLAKTN